MAFVNCQYKINNIFNLKLRVKSQSCVHSTPQFGLISISMFTKTETQNRIGTMAIKTHNSTHGVYHRTSIILNLFKSENTINK